MARYNSINTTSSVSGGSTISTPASGLLTTLTGSGTINIPSPILYVGSTQTFYNSTGAAITLSTPSGNIVGPGLGGGATTLSLPAGSIITLVSDGANYLTQDWIGGQVNASTLSVSSTVNLSPATGTITINPTSAGTIANMAISGGSGSFSTLAASGITSITGATAVTLGTAASGVLQVTGGVGIGGGITVASDSYFGSKITIGVATPRQALTIGQNATSVSTATPDSIDIGGTYSSTAGQNLKLKLWNAVAVTNSYIGLGISGNSLDYVVNDNGTNTFSHNWYTGKGSSTTPVQVMSLTSGGVLTFPQTTGVKIRLYDASNDKYGFEVQSSELRMYSGAQGVASGGITFGKYDGTTWTENIRFTNAGNLGVGTVTPAASLDLGSRTDAVILPTGTTAQRPTGVNGMIRYNTTLNAVEVYRTSITAWSSIALADVGTELFPATSATQILQLRPSAASGYYYIKPDGITTYYVYCDMVTDGGGWMLMINARPNNGGQYYSNSDYGLSTFGAYTYPEYNKSTTSMFGPTIVNKFFQIAGFKYGRVTPGPGVTINSPYTGLYQRIGTTTSAQWGGTQFDCSNRANLTGATFSWVLTQYKNWSDAQAAANGRVGGYTGGSHYYPTTYDSGWQNFWKGDSDGLRFSSDFNSENYGAIGQNTSPGYWWIKTT